MAIELFFNEKLHKYTDSRNLAYTSMTTVIGKYEVKFDTEKMSKIVIKSKKSQYYGWTAQRVKQHWKELNEKSLVKGNRIHNYLEERVKESSGYKLVDGHYIHDKIYTVNNLEELLQNNANVGELSLERLIEMDILNKYPRIFKTIAYYVNKGFRIFSEIGIFDEKRLISGLIDILLINMDAKEFIILDWKTNKDKIIPFDDDRYKWVSGYFKKDKFGNTTEEFAKTNTYFLSPLNRFQQSHYLIYALQLSGYATLVENLGYKNIGIILAHIREGHTYTEYDKEVNKTPDCLGKTVTDILVMDYLKEDMEALFNNHFLTYTEKQGQLIF